MTIISDLDGTLLSPQGAVPNQLHNVISAIDSFGSNLVVATSRPFDDVYRIFGAYGLAFLAILNDGSETIEIQPEGDFAVLDELVLDPDDIDVLLALAVEGNILPFTFLTHSAKLPGMVVCPPFLAEERHQLNLLTPGRPYQVSDSVTAYISVVMHSQAIIRAIAYFVRDKHIQEIREHISPALENTRSVKVLDYPDMRCKGYYWIEMVPSLIGKRGAIERLLDRNLIQRPLIGLGNGRNDVDFLRACDYALCPSDAESSVLEVVNEVAPVGGGAVFCDWISSKLQEIYVKFQL